MDFLFWVQRIILSENYLIVGLGNPGKDYQNTRHNLGFMVIQELAEKLNFKLGLSSFTNGITAEGRKDQNDICLLMPLTYMNNSGAAVHQVIKTKNISVEKVLVICDDFNLSFGQMRIRSKGSDGGHNGLKSIIEKTQMENFHRLRMGIGEPKRGEVIDYVLEEFSASERKLLKEYVEQAASCCLVWITEGVEKAMDLYNRKK